ncbi:MAG: sigma-70 family RNA polymerase sigma factor [Bacteroidota bacterium]|nr:sigma-70 family RNA polymerase sigma factor [Bacteroidota bacterium]
MNNLEESFVNEITQNQNLIHKICRIYAIDSDEHKDLFQEITIQLWKSYPKFEHKSKFSTWAYRIALNTAITLFKKKKTKKIDTTTLDNNLFFINSQEYDTQEEEQLQLLYKAIHRLGDIEKALIYMYLEDKDYKEIAETLGISEVNARVKMNRIKNKLKELIQP